MTEIKVLVNKRNKEKGIEKEIIKLGLRGKFSKFIKIIINQYLVR